MITELSLFTGGGGGVLASLLLGHRIIGMVEQNEYCCERINDRQNEGVLPRFPIFNCDIREFISSGIIDLYKGKCDVVSGGFPCQPFSTAGKQAAEKDSRNMWPEMLECISRIRPRIAFLENVPALISCGYLGTILSDLQQIRYDARWTTLSSAEVGGFHKRERLWIVAYPCGQPPRMAQPNASDEGWTATNDNTRTMVRQGNGQVTSEGCISRFDPAHAKGKQRNGAKRQTPINSEQQESQPRNRLGQDDPARANGKQCQGVIEEEVLRQRGEGREGFRHLEMWSRLSNIREPLISGMDDEMADRVDLIDRSQRTKAIGNGQDPLVAEMAFRLLTAPIEEA